MRTTIHWGRLTHICASKLTSIGSDNGLAPSRRQAIIWTNAGILLIGPLGTHLSEIIIEIQFENVVCEKQPFCIGLNVLIVPHVLNVLNVVRNLRIPYISTYSPCIQWVGCVFITADVRLTSPMHSLTHFLSPFLTTQVGRILEILSREVQCGVVITRPISPKFSQHTRSRRYFRKKMNLIDIICTRYWKTNYTQQNNL